MPPLTTIPRQPSGQIGRIQPITPTATPNVSLSRAQQQAGGMGVQAAQITAQSAKVHSEIGAALHAQGMELLKPLEELKKSKEVIAANDIIIKSLLDVRGKSAAIQTGDQPYEQHLSLVNEEFNRTEQIALKEAQSISPAAFEHVQRALGSERLRLIGDVQQDTIKREVDNQLVKLDRMDTFVRQQLTQTTDPAARLDLINYYNQSYDAAVQHGVMRATDAQTKRTDFNKYVVTDAALTTGQAEGYLAAEKYLKEQSILGKDEQRVTLGKVEDSLRYAEKARSDAEKAAEKQIRREQEVVASTIRHRVLSTDLSVNQLNDIGASIPTLVRMGSLHDDDITGLQHDIARRVDELNNPKPKPPNLEAEYEVTSLIAQAPDDITESEISRYPGLNAAQIRTLLEMKRSTKDARSITKLETYQHHIKLISSLETDDDIVAMLKGDELPSFRTAIRRAITAYHRTIQSKAASLPNGIMTEEEIQKFDGYVESLIEQIKPTTAATSSGPSLDSFK